MKIHFNGTVPVEHKDILFNVDFARAADIPYCGIEAAHDRALAVVGGGPSILDQLDELRSFEGDIWAINGACAFLRSHGIEATLFGVDPHAIVRQWAPGAKKAILCSRTDWHVWGILADAEVHLFDLAQENPETGITCGSSTATCAFDLATNLGYRKVYFYGCEGSYPGAEIGNDQDRSHAYTQEKHDDRMLVSCGDGEYLTRPDFLVQCDEMAKMLKVFPDHFQERSGGLLRAMVANDDYDIVKVSRSLMANLRFKEESCPA